MEIEQLKTSEYLDIGDDEFLMERKHNLSKLLMRKIQDKDESIKIDFLKLLFLEKYPSIYDKIEPFIETKISRFELLEIIKPVTLFTKQIKSHIENVNTIDVNKPVVSKLNDMNIHIIREYKKHLIPVLVTVRFDTSISFHDAWHRVNYDVSTALSIIKDISIISFSTIEYDHNKQPNYMIKKPHTDKYYKFFEETLKGIYNIYDYCINSICPFIYFPSDLSIKIYLYKYYAIKFCKNKWEKLKSKDSNKHLYSSENEKNINRMTGETYHRCYLANQIKNEDLPKLLELLENYFHVILYNRKNKGDRGEDFTYEYINFCKYHYDKIREGILDGNTKKLINEYFPTYTMREIGEDIGFFKIDETKIKGEEEKKQYFQVYNTFTYSNDIYVEYTFFTFLAYQHKINSGSVIGYPHFHISFLMETRDHSFNLEIIQDIKIKLKEKLDLKDIVVDLKDTNDYTKSIGYTIKNSRIAYVDKMLSQINYYGDKIREEGNPYIFVDINDMDFYRIIEPDILEIAGGINGLNSNIDSERCTWIPMKIRYNKTNREIATEILQKISPETLVKMNENIAMEKERNKIFNITMITPNEKCKKIIWIRYIQQHMIENKLVICDNRIFKIREESKYSFNVEMSIEEYVGRFSTSITPPAPDSTLSEYLIKIMNIKNEKKYSNETLFNFPQVNINFRLYEYKDFILDTINRCIIDKPPEGHYCYLYFGDISKENYISKVIELIEDGNLNFEDYQDGRTKGRLIGLLKHLNIYDIEFLSYILNTIVPRFRKKDSLLYLGDASSYKSALALLMQIVFPDYKVSRLTKGSKFELFSQLIGALVIYAEECHVMLESIKGSDGGSFLKVSGGEIAEAEGKGLNIQLKIPTANMSFIGNCNINENTLKYIKHEAFLERFNIFQMKKNPIDFGVVKEAEFISCLPEFLLLITMANISKDYYDCEKLPILKSFKELPEPLIRVLNYWQNECDSKYLIPKDGIYRNALQLRESVFELRTNHDFISLENTLLKIGKRDQFSTIENIYEKSKSEQKELKATSKLDDRECDRDVRIIIADKEEKQRSKPQQNSKPQPQTQLLYQKILLPTYKS